MTSTSPILSMVDSVTSVTITKSVSACHSSHQKNEENNPMKETVMPTLSMIIKHFPALA